MTTQRTPSSGTGDQDLDQHAEVQESPGAGGADAPPVEAALEPEPEPEGGRELEEAQAQAAEYLALAQRKQAEFENFRKRMSVQAAQAQDRGVAKAAKELLAPLDHLRLAVEHADEASRGPLESLHQEFLGALARVGVESFAPVGEVFDPTLHEAMAQAPVEGAESGTVAEVYQAGYRIGDVVLRPARVVVAA